MSKILDKWMPEIKIHKYLGKELEALRETFDRNWDEKRDGWRDETIDWLAGRLNSERIELEKAIKEMWEDAFFHYSLIVRMKQVHMEWLDVALVALLGADRTRREYESLEKRLKERPKGEAPESELEIIAVEAEPDYSMTEEEQMADVASQIIEAVTKPKEAEPQKIRELEVALANKDEEDFQAEEARKAESEEEE